MGNMRQVTKQVLKDKVPAMNGRIIGKTTGYFTKPVEQIGEVMGKGKDKRRKAKYFSNSQKPVPLLTLFGGVIS